MTEISILDELPEISIIEEEGLTIENIIDEMVEDYERQYEELTGEELTLYPTDERRILINVAAGKVFQLVEIMDDRFRQNFIKYMYGDILKNWAGNFGFFDDGLEYAHVTLRFTLSETQTGEVMIPQGTRATAGDNVFFTTEEDGVIEPGEISADVPAVCTEAGTVGNNYSPGQINVIVDPINLVASVINPDTSEGGHDEYTNDELKLKIINFPSTYSTAGPIGSYEELAKQYSDNIVDAKVITDEENASLEIYLMLADCMLPTEDYCSMVRDYVLAKKCTPATDRVSVKAPEVVNYTINATYYIPEDRKDVEQDIRSMIEAAGEEFAADTASRVGRAVNPDIFIGYGMAAGVSRLIIESPAYIK